MSDTRTPAKPLPDTADPVVAPYWAGTREGKLLVSRCAHCSYRLWPPEPVCPECLEEKFVWEEVPQIGVLWSYAVYERALDPAFADEIPYVVGLVQIAEDVKMYGIMRGPADLFRIGTAMRAEFEAVNDAVTFVRWCVD